MEEDTQDSQDGTNRETAAQAQASLNKACEACRQSKLRCIVEDSHVDGSCRRCIATGRECVFKAPRARQRRRLHVDARVAELEKQLRVLRMQLDQAQRSSDGSGGAPGAATTVRFEPPVTPASWPRKTANTAKDLVPYDDGRPATSQRLDLKMPDDRASTTNDVVARNLLSWKEAEDLIAIYLQLFASLYPFVTLPGYAGPEALRQQRPATFLAILAAASITGAQALHKSLNHELLVMIAQRTMLEGVHDLDLVQAMIVMTIWYAPLDKFESLRHYQYAHLAATIATDIGLGSSNQAARSIQEDLDRRRTLLAIYLLCTGISVTTGRTNMLRFDQYKQNCIDVLKSQSPISETDRWFVAWVELQRLTEIAGEDFFYDPVDISASENQAKVTNFCERLESWKRTLGFELGGALEIHYYYARSIVLCSFLYVNHDVEDFRPPFRIRPLDADVMPGPSMSPWLNKTAQGLLASVHAALDAFLSFNELALIAAPMVYYVRTCHPLSILLILDMDCRRPGSELSKIIDQQDLNVNHYFQALKQMLLRISASQPSKTSARFLSLVQKMEIWWLSQIGSSQAGKAVMHAQDLRPFMSADNDDGSTFGGNRRVKSHTNRFASDGRLTMPQDNLPAAPFALSDGSVMPMEQQDILLENWVLDLQPDPTNYPSVYANTYPNAYAAQNPMSELWYYANNT